MPQYPENETDTLIGWLNRLGSSNKIDLTEEFREWLRGEYKDKDGENIKPNSVSSYVNALLYLTDNESYPGRYDVRSVTYWYNMYHFLYGCDGSSVFTVSEESELKKRYANIIAAVNLENAPEGVDVNKFNEVKAWCQEPKTKKSGWIKSAFNRYFDFLEWRKVRKNKVEPKVSTSDLLSVALKMFTEKRKEGEWCSDKTDGDANKPRKGLVANKMRRGASVAAPAVAQLQHGTAAQIRAWFNSASDPYSLKSVVDEVDDGDIVTFGPYLAHLIQPQSPAPARPAKFTPKTRTRRFRSWA